MNRDIYIIYILERGRPDKEGGRACVLACVRESA